MTTNSRENGSVYWRKYNSSPERAAYLKAYSKSEKQKENLARYRTSEKGRARIHRSMIKARYGITEKDYENMFRSQNGLCAICEGLNTNGKRLSVDHDHKTKRVRALLCQKCNAILGLAGENILLLYKAADYLERFNRVVVLK